MEEIATNPASSPVRFVAGMPGGMMHLPLTIGAILDHTVRNSPRRGIVSRDGDRTVRYSYAQFAGRVARLANALTRLGVRPGDRVASFAWNTHRHLELYYAVPMIGAVLHTTNIRLFPEQVAYVLDHAGDRVVFVDGSLVAAMRAVIATSPNADRRYVVMGDCPEPLEGAERYEALLSAETEDVVWPAIDENQAAILCYTSATTGDPKAVAFSHRSTYLHALATGLADALAVRERDVVLPFVPMFHVNAWGIPFAAPMVGANLVFPGARLDPQSAITLIEEEGVTFALGVPTVWLGIRDALVARNAGLPSLNRVVVGGSAAPDSLIDDMERLGIQMIHAWGMTEMSPIGTVATDVCELARDPEAQRRARYKQGRFSPLVAWRIVDEHGMDVPADGVSRGELLVRGYAVAREYYQNAPATAAAFTDGWFHTGDVVTVDANGYMEIVDRVKDFIKSGGEWISSVEVENLLMGHPAVKEACVFGVPHPQWQERPIAAVVFREGESCDEATLRAWLGERLAKWQIPDRVVALDAIPRTGVGKFLKRDLRERYADLLTARDELSRVGERR